MARKLWSSEVGTDKKLEPETGNDPAITLYESVVIPFNYSGGVLMRTRTAIQRFRKPWPCPVRR